jgi:hypothetical protein
MAGLDANPYLIGFDNGVFDLEHSKFHPRGSVPVDMLVSMTTGYDYVGAADGTPVDAAQAAEMEALECAVYDKLLGRLGEDVLGAQGKSWLTPFFISVFDATAKQDDPVNFVWKAQQAPLHMLLMLKYARRFGEKAKTDIQALLVAHRDVFIQNGHRLPAVPDCSASKQEIDMLGRGF